MPRLLRPDSSFLDRARRELAGSPFTYADVGATGGEFPGGYDVDRQRISLGHGEDVFEAAKDALCQWRQFPRDWTAIHPADAPLTPGTEVVVLCRVLGLWWANGARIIYTVDEAGPPRRFGFAYGTLPSHIECGEERFVVEMDESGQVWYDLSSFSRPCHWLVRLGYPLVRRYQAKFRRDSAAAMQAAVCDLTRCCAEPRP